MIAAASPAAFRLPSPTAMCDQEQAHQGAAAAAAHLTVAASSRPFRSLRVASSISGSSSICSSCAARSCTRYSASPPCTMLARCQRGRGVGYSFFCEGCELGAAVVDGRWCLHALQAPAAGACSTACKVDFRCKTEQHSSLQLFYRCSARCCACFLLPASRSPGQHPI